MKGIGQKTLSGFADALQVHESVLVSQHYEDIDEKEESEQVNLVKGDAQLQRAIDLIKGIKTYEAFKTQPKE